MPPKVSQLLTRVLARDHDGIGGTSSESEKDLDYGLQQMAATASPGLLMEMEMLRESRARDKGDGIHRDACIVDRNQFFNTQVGVGYQHKKVVRQRTASSGGGEQKVIDMSTAKVKIGKRARLKDESDRESDSSSDDTDERDGKKISKKKGKKTKKNRKKKKRGENEDRALRKSKKSKKSSTRRKRSDSRVGRHRTQRAESANVEREQHDPLDKGSSSRSRKHKMKKRHQGKVDPQTREGFVDGGANDARGSRRLSSSSDSSEHISSDSAGDSDAGSATRPGNVGEGHDLTTKTDTLQRFRDLLESRIRGKAQARREREGRCVAVPSRE